MQSDFPFINSWSYHGVSMEHVEAPPILSSLARYSRYFFSSTPIPVSLHRSEFFLPVTFFKYSTIHLHPSHPIPFPPIISPSTIMKTVRRTRWIILAYQAKVPQTAPSSSDERWDLESSRTEYAHISFALKQIFAAVDGNSTVLWKEIRYLGWSSVWVGNVRSNISFHFHTIPKM